MMMRILLAIGLAGFFVPSNANSLQKLAPFSTDGCSLFPNGTPEKPNLWLHCCKAHDLDYWQGGTRAQRLLSDLKLQQCVADTGQAEIAILMFNGVRVGGSPALPTPFRWGYGWPFSKKYGELTAIERYQIKQLFPVKYLVQ